MKKPIEKVLTEMPKHNIVEPKPDTDPIIQIKNRIEELEFAWTRVSLIKIETDDDNTYSTGWETKKKDLRKIEIKIQQNRFALDILTNLNVVK